MPVDKQRLKSRTWAFFLILPLALTIAISVWQASAAEQAAIGPNCRNGVGGWNNLMQSMGAGWLVDFGGRNLNTYPAAVEYAPMVRIRPIYSPPNDPFNRTGNYQVTNPPLGDGPTQLGGLVTANPGRLWLIGNEMDRPDDIVMQNGVPTRFISQDNLMPDTYARAYHDVYHYIKARDPLAQIAIGGIIQASPGRMQYLDLVWSSYKQQFGKTMPVDVWNIHIYKIAERKFGTAGGWQDWSAAAVANGTDPNLAIYFRDPNNFFGGGSCPQTNIMCLYEHTDFNLFKNDVIVMRQWMAAKGERNKPLIVSEFSVLWPYVDEGGGNCFVGDEHGNCFTPSRVANFLTQTTNYLETATDANIGYPLDNNRLVQRWIWYPANVETDEAIASSSKLTNNSETALSPIGIAYRDHIAGQSLFVDWVMDSVGSGVAVIPSGQSTGSANVKVWVRNRGTSRSQSAATVVFRNAANAVIGTAAIPAQVQGCTTELVEVEGTVTGLTRGLHTFTATIETGTGDNEPSVSNNSGTNTILAGPDYIIHMPTVNN